MYFFQPFLFSRSTKDCDKKHVSSGAAPCEPFPTQMRGHVRAPARNKSSDIRRAAEASLRTARDADWRSAVGGVVTKRQKSPQQLLAPLLPSTGSSANPHRVRGSASQRPQLEASTALQVVSSGPPSTPPSGSLDRFKLPAPSVASLGVPPSCKPLLYHSPRVVRNSTSLLDESGLESAFAGFIASEDADEHDDEHRDQSQHPGWGAGYDYAATQVIDMVREREFSLLNKLRHTYLDYTGGCLTPVSLVYKHMELLTSTLLGNPHSKNAPSMASSALEARARLAVLKFFNASPEGTLLFVVATTFFLFHSLFGLKTLQTTLSFSQVEQLMLSSWLANPILSRHDQLSCTLRIIIIPWLASENLRIGLMPKLLWRRYVMAT